MVPIEVDGKKNYGLMKDIRSMTELDATIDKQKIVDLLRQEPMRAAEIGRKLNLTRGPTRIRLAALLARGDVEREYELRRVWTKKYRLCKKKATALESDGK